MYVGLLTLYTVAFNVILVTSGIPSALYLNNWSPVSITYSFVASCPFKFSLASSAKLSQVNVPVNNTLPASNLIKSSATLISDVVLSYFTHFNDISCAFCSIAVEFFLTVSLSPVSPLIVSSSSLIVLLYVEDVSTTLCILVITVPPKPNIPILSKLLLYSFILNEAVAKKFKIVVISDEFILPSLIAVLTLLFKFVIALSNAVLHSFKFANSLAFSVILIFSKITV